MNASGWKRWQSDVVVVIRSEYQDLFPLIRTDEIDWQAWQTLYDQGFSAREAVGQALSGSVARAHKPLASASALKFS
jgi:hypothetical protein